LRERKRRSETASKGVVGNIAAKKKKDKMRTNFNTKAGRKKLTG